MKLLLSSIGSRGDVQPLVALALELRALGHMAVLCVAPNFQPWIEAFGLQVVPIGPDLEALTRAAPAQSSVGKASPEQLRQLARYTVAEQFRVIPEAAQGCDLILVGGMLQTAGRSTAEALGVPYVYAAYCPATLPSQELPPATIGTRHPMTLSASENRRLWLADAQSFNAMFGAALNEQRVAMGLTPVSEVARHIMTDHPWLAADPLLAPAATPLDLTVNQTGAWALPDPRPLPALLEQFLAAGDPPIYIGFGSMPTAKEQSQALITAARSVGRRILLLRGWGHLDGIDDGGDVFVTDDVNHQRLLPRVAAVVHHGGAGTTTAAARAGRPQVIIPHLYDQYYWANRVETLGIGVEGPPMAELNAATLAQTLTACLAPERAARAEAVSNRMEPDGAKNAAAQLISLLENQR